MAEKTGIQSYKRIAIDFTPEIPQLKNIKDKTQIDVRYCLISPFVFAHIYWDAKAYEIVYKIEEPEIDLRELKYKEQIVSAMQDMINFDMIVKKDKESLLDYIDKRFKL